jgi:hypothetical protein
MTWEILIPLIALGLNLMAIGLELALHDRKKAKELNLAVRRKQRELKELQKKTKDAKELMAANKEMMGLMGKQFRLNMKTMFITFPLFIIMFWLLSGMLSFAPAYAGKPFEVGAMVRNMVDSPVSLEAELVPGVELAIVEDPVKKLTLDDKGDQGDAQELWWEVTASTPGEKKAYSVRLTIGNESEGLDYHVKVVPQGELIYQFSPPTETSKPFEGKLEATPIYKAREFNVFGFKMSWFWYYFISYFLISLLMSPVKNRVLWGHWRGIKHLEKLENETKKV